jgi:XTP/dITP diphosphohydrolase
MYLIVASNNPGKLRELQALLGRNIHLRTLAEIGLVPPEETGATFVENALIKAHAAAVTGQAAIADDSGLEVDALGGAPGVQSARYAGPGASDHENNAKLLAALTAVPFPERAARFKSAVALVMPDGQEYVATGTIEGRILHEPRGHNGFGYDPLFEIEDPEAREFTGRTMAELRLPDKNRISHRARAYRALSAVLARRGINLVEPAASHG